MYVENYKYYCKECGAVFDWPSACDDVPPVRNEYGMPVWLDVCPGCGSVKFVRTRDLSDPASITDFEPVISHCSPGNVLCIDLFSERGEQ